MSLPPELRRKIYQNLLTVETCRGQKYIERDLKYGTGSRISVLGTQVTSQSGLTSYEYHRDTGLCTQILLVNRLIYEKLAPSYTVKLVMVFLRSLSE